MPLILSETVFSALSTSRPSPRVVATQHLDGCRTAVETQPSVAVATVAGDPAAFFRPRGRGLAARNRWPNASEPCCTTRRHTTHNTDLLEVCYPWHPWHGLKVFVLQSVTKGGQTFLRCSPELDAASRNREIPLWMFDRALCCTMRLAPTPWVPVDELRQLRELLRAAATGVAVVKDHHPPSSSKGDSDAETAPRYLIRDRDSIYGAEVRRCLAGLNIEEVLAAPRSP